MVVTYDNILSDIDYNFINTESLFEYSNHINVKSNSKIWNSSVIEFSKEVQILQLDSNSKSYKIIKSLVDTLTSDDYIVAVLYHYWKPGTYIPWHNDTDYSGAITIYLNEKWVWKNGGIFQYEINGNIISVIPNKNLGILQKDGVWHSTTIVSKDSPTRRTVQIFLKEKPKNSII